MEQFDNDIDMMPNDKKHKPTYIKEQHNYNCQQFFGPINNSTFIMPAVSPTSKSKAKSNNPKTKVESKPASRPFTLKYYKHGNNGFLLKQRQRVNIIFRKWTEWKWIDSMTSADDFDSFFEGERRHCNINWIASSTILTILLQELLEQPYIEKQKGLSAKSLVMQQFGKTANSDRNRLDSDAEEKIKLTLLILDTNNPLPEVYTDDNKEEYDTSDSALMEIYSGQLHLTKAITM